MSNYIKVVENITILLINDLLIHNKGGFKQNVKL